MDRDYPALAAELLAPHARDPAPRALRIAALYAAFYLEEPFLFRWGGIAAFVALHIHRALHLPVVSVGGGVLSEEVHAVLGEANLAIYERLVPDWLRFRDRVAVRGVMAAGFDDLRRADLDVATDPVGADAAVLRGVITLSRIEQREVVQPLLDRLAPEVQRGLAPFYLFRLGLDSGAPLRRFTGNNPADFEQRWAWTERDVLPWCWRELDTRAEEVRADADRLRRRAGVRALPARLPR